MMERLRRCRRKKKVVCVIVGMCITILYSFLFAPLDLWAKEISGQGETELADSNSDKRDLLGDLGLDEIDRPKVENQNKGNGIEECQKTGETVQWDIREIDLKLEYDDRCFLGDLEEGLERWQIVNIKTIRVDSKKVSGGIVEEEADDQVVLCETDEEAAVRAVGVGSAEILLVSEEQSELTKKILEEPGEMKDRDEVIRAVRVNVTVEPAVLTLMYVMGQSNAEGLCSSNTGYVRTDSVMCKPGEVYSTYAPTTSNSEKIAGVSFTKYCTKDNASEFVAGSLRGDQNIVGGQLEYPLNALTALGNGKTGIDSGLAYEWNRLTGDKVWVINTARSGSSIVNWCPETVYYDRAMTVSQLAMQTCQAEVEAGHYRAGSSLLFWQQGEADKRLKAEEYYVAFSTMYKVIVRDLNLDAFGIVMCNSIGIIFASLSVSAYG